MCFVEKVVIFLFIIMFSCIVDSYSVQVPERAHSVYGYYDWKVGDNWVFSIDVYGRCGVMLGRLKQPECIPGIDYKYILTLKIEKFDTLPSSVICWKIIAEPSIVKSDYLDTCIMWMDVEKGCLKKVETKISKQTWEVINNCRMFDVNTTFMPIAFLPWVARDSIDKINKSVIPPIWDSVRQSLKLKCDDYLSIKCIKNEECVVECKQYSAECEIKSRVRQVWSRKYGWWTTYEHYDYLGNINEFGKLILKNGKPVNFEGNKR